MAQDNCCPICQMGELKRIRTTETFSYKGKKITIDNYIIWKCSECGEAIVDKRTLKRTDKLLKDFRKKIDEE
ncbi:MAG TPA: YgiT-type zinc finger protein [Thermodesulfovibrio thiophilus]|nr:YgiT-type zinc finger protein [Thermodesulfovibrio thiophilus]